MIRVGRRFGFAFGLLALSALATAGDETRDRVDKMEAPLEIPHTTDLEFADRANKKHDSGTLEKTVLVEHTRGLSPLPFTRNSDIRARLLTPELRKTPLLGWLAENLYRGKDEKGWCIEADPGQSEYVVFYRLHLK